MTNRRRHGLKVQQKPGHAFQRSLQSGAVTYSLRRHVSAVTTERVRGRREVLPPRGHADTMQIVSEAIGAFFLTRAAELEAPEPMCLAFLLNTSRTGAG